MAKSRWDASFWDTSSVSLTVGATHCTFSSHIFPGKPVGFLVVESPTTCSQDTPGTPWTRSSAGSSAQAASSCPPSSAPLQLLQADKKHVGFLSRAAADPHGQGFPVKLQAAGRGQGLTPGTVWGWNCGEHGQFMPQAQLAAVLVWGIQQQTGSSLLM